MILGLDHIQFSKSKTLKKNLKLENLNYSLSSKVDFLDIDIEKHFYSKKRTVSFYKKPGSITIETYDNQGEEIAPLDDYCLIPNGSLKKVNLKSGIALSIRESPAFDILEISSKHSDEYKKIFKNLGFVEINLTDFVFPQTIFNSKFVVKLLKKYDNSLITNRKSGKKNLELGIPGVPILALIVSSINEFILSLANYTEIENVSGDITLKNSRLKIAFLRLSEQIVIEVIEIDRRKN